MTRQKLGRLIFETVGDPPVRLRLVWDVSEPADMRWRNEMSVSGARWSLVSTTVPPCSEPRSRARSE
jgi:hypothetical protein